MRSRCRWLATGSRSQFNCIRTRRFEDWKTTALAGNQCHCCEASHVQSCGVTFTESKTKTKTTDPLLSTPGTESPSSTEANFPQIRNRFFSNGQKSLKFSENHPKSLKIFSETDHHPISMILDKSKWGEDVEGTGNVSNRRQKK